MSPRTTSAALTKDQSDEYTTRTVERRTDGWTVEIIRRPEGWPMTRALVNVGSISHLLASIEAKAQEAE